MKRIRNLNISNIDDEQHITFDFYNNNICEAMVFRRALMYIPKFYAIDEIVFHDDNMIMYREQLAQRMGMLYLDNENIGIDTENQDEFRIRFFISGKDIGATEDKYSFLKASDIKPLNFVYDSYIMPMFIDDFINIDIYIRKGRGTIFERYSFYIDHVSISENNSHYSNNEISQIISNLLIDNDNPGEQIENENNVLLSLTFTGNKTIKTSDISEVNFIGDFELFTLDLEESIKLEISIVSNPTHAKWIPVVIAPTVIATPDAIKFTFIPTGVLSYQNILQQVETYMDNLRENYDISCFYRQNRL